MNTDAGSSPYELSFSRVHNRSWMTSPGVPPSIHGQDELYNPYEEARQYFQSNLEPLILIFFHQLVETPCVTLLVVCVINTLQERDDSCTDPGAKKPESMTYLESSGVVLYYLCIF